MVARSFRQMFGSHGAILYRFVYWTMGFVLSAELARADTEAIRIEYRAEESCPNAARFSDEVLRRARNARLAIGNEASRTFFVTIQRKGTNFAGTLVIRDERRDTMARRVTAADCNDVAKTLAFSTALAIDPNAPDPATDTEPPAPASKTERSTNDSQKEPTRQRDDAKASNAPAPGRQEEERHEPEQSEPATKSWSYALALGPELRSGNTPRIALGGALALEARRSPASASLSAVALELSFLSSLASADGGASSTFQLLLARPRFCALATDPFRGVRLNPCLVAELGLVAGRSSGLPVTATERRFWAAVELPLRAELTLSPRMLFALSAGPVFPITRYRFLFLDPETTVYRVPVVGVSLGAALGMTL
jgi:hypothetical protein